MECLDIAQLLAPVLPDAFWREYFGEQFLLVAGQPDKFEGLFSWRALNEILRHHRFGINDLRLVKDANNIPLESFVYDDPAFPSLRADLITKYLSDGATLIVNNLDRRSPTVMRLAEELEHEFEVPVNVNLYAGWRTTKGFDLHWDNHDVFIAQVSGSKDWKLFRPTEVYPVDHKRIMDKPDVSEAAPPTGTSAWSGTLTAGDLLYIPRGWWHEATPRNEPTCHLTIGIKRPNGLDLMRWLVQRLHDQARFRKDLPRNGDLRACADHLVPLREAVHELLSKPDVIADFSRDMNAMAKPRPAFALPWTACLDNTAFNDDSLLIRLLVPRHMILDHDERAGTLRLHFDGRTFTFTESTLSLFEYLRDNRNASLMSFKGQFAGVFSPAQIREFLVSLLALGIATVELP